MGRSRRRLPFNPEPEEGERAPHKKIQEGLEITGGGPETTPVRELAGGYGLDDLELERIEESEQAEARQQDLDE